MNLVEKKSSMYWVNPSAEPWTDTTSRFLVDIVAKLLLNAWDIQELSVYSQLLNSIDLVFKFCLFLLGFKILLIATHVCFTSFLCFRITYGSNLSLRIDFCCLFYFWTNYTPASTFYFVCIGWNSDAFSLC